MTVSKFAVSPNKEVFLRIVLEYADVIEKCEHSCSEFLLIDISEFLLVNKKYLADGPFLKALINKYRKLALVNKEYQKYYDELFGRATDTDVYDFTDIRTCIQSELNSNENLSVVESTEKGFHECKVDEERTKRCYNEKGQLHREGGPAIVRANGDKEWWVNGKRHRTDGPATERVSGTKKWYQNDKLHRTDGPAIEYSGESTGDSSWYHHGKLHRTDGPARDWPSEGTKEWYFEGNEVEPMFHEYEEENGVKKYFNEKGEKHHTHGPAVIKPNGMKKWYQNGKLHRKDGPAAVYPNGDTTWCQNGERHRVGGPAVEWPSGYHEYWENGKKISTPYFRCEINKDGKSYYDEKNRFHRQPGCGPAIEIDAKDTKIKLYYIHGCIFHPSEKPEWDSLERSVKWKVDGKLHRDYDRPAVIHDEGHMEWWADGKRHREGDLPAIKWRLGAEEWWMNGERHRDPKCGPAVTNATTTDKLPHRQCHRPSDKYTAYHDSGKCEWWVNDKKLEMKTIRILAKESSTIIQKLSEYMNYRVVGNIVLQFVDSRDYSVTVKTDCSVFYIESDTTDQELFDNYISIREQLFDQGKPNSRPIFIYSSSVSGDIKSKAQAYSPNTYEENDIDSILSAIKSI